MQGTTVSQKTLNFVRASGWCRSNIKQRNTVVFLFHWLGDLLSGDKVVFGILGLHSLSSGFWGCWLVRTTCPFRRTTFILAVEIRNLTFNLSSEIINTVKERIHYFAGNDGDAFKQYSLFVRCFSFCSKFYLNSWAHMNGWKIKTTPTWSLRTNSELEKNLNLQTLSCTILYHVHFLYQTNLRTCEKSLFQMLAKKRRKNSKYL